MTAAPKPVESGTTATDASPLDGDLFDRLTHELGADDDSARAKLLGVDRATLYRWRHGKYAPRHEIAARIAKTLGTTVDDLFPGARS